MKPEKLFFTKDHEWVEQGPADVRVGITAFAAHELGDIVFVELPDVGDEFGAGEAFGNVESVKAVSPLNRPIAGTIAAVNGRLEDEPELVNQSPLDEGWMIKVTPSDDGGYDGLLDQAAYDEFVKSQA